MLSLSYLHQQVCSYDRAGCKAIAVSACNIMHDTANHSVHASLDSWIDFKLHSLRFCFESNHTRVMTDGLGSCFFAVNDICTSHTCMDVLRVTDAPDA